MHERVGRRIRSHETLQQYVKNLYQYISDKDKGNGRHSIAEKLHPAMQVWLRENHVTRERETHRETDGKRDNPGGNRRSHVETPEQGNVFSREQEFQAQWVDADINHHVRTPARQVTECLSGDKTSERLMEPVKSSYNNAACLW